MRIRSSIFVLCLAAVLALPGVAYAAKATKDTTSTYALDFTLPTAGKSGCMVCHGDPNLVKVAGEVTSTIFVSVQQLDSSAHKADLCTGCHLDFAYTAPHDNVKGTTDWKSVAKLSCKNCKDHKPQFTEYTAGAHSPAGKPGEAAAVTLAARRATGKPLQVPLCGDCHSSHSIPSKEDTAARAVYRSRGVQICGGCHTVQANNYNDYYHGAAYQQGAADAPTCWDCHGTHLVLPTSDRRSMVNERNLVDTCGQDGCHVNVDEDFLVYAKFIHGRTQMVASNPIRKFYDSARIGIEGVFKTIGSWFGRG
ncbi:MAG: hypothetical protein CVT67_11230 [Actinobacteria bacterium HGW-Actinobacteria-7]|nr:MAG: hypothetical protein CVT67_11230 [Actinobacteria bacterium HGW-Actinobacteria-7]